MGIVTGYICLLCFTVLVLKALTRTLRLNGPDSFLKRLHKPISGLTVILFAVHIIFVYPVLKTRAAGVVITGAAAVIIYILLVLLCHTIRRQEKKLRWHRLSAFLLILCAAGHMVTYFIDFNRYQSRMNQITLEEMNAEDLKDGVYIGEYDAGYIFARVQVTVTGGAIKDIIILEHRNERGQKAEKVADDIVDTQTFPVDAVSGATNSGRVIQMAVQNALKGGNIHE